MIKHCNSSGIISGTNSGMKVKEDSEGSDGDYYYKSLCSTSIQLLAMLLGVGKKNMTNSNADMNVTSANANTSTCTNNKNTKIFLCS